MGAPVNIRVVISKPRFTQNYAMLVFHWPLEDSNVTKNNISQAFVDLSLGGAGSIKTRNLHQFLRHDTLQQPRFDYIAGFSRVKQYLCSFFVARPCFNDQVLYWELVGLFVFNAGDYFMENPRNFFTLRFNFVEETDSISLLNNVVATHVTWSCIITVL